LTDFDSEVKADERDEEGLTQIVSVEHVGDPKPVNESEAEDDSQS